MEQTPIPPLLSDEILAHLNCRCENCVRRVAEVIEADRAKTREVVQALVDAAKKAQEAMWMSRSNNECRGEYYDGWCSQALPYTDEALALAKSQLNISPTKP